ncbi:uncharacterized protein BDZ99DRAFT_432150 [Mytilinidion resinicola]|uniref:Fungal N-terminal domain-containing protein n=1 Tax=Mytilinidion resinicola TaxID=574789 RepID=A0A6A6ZAC3_9PEZI|nr:uncharacterized protein BDZ99DRAFT_432150 [Mytilinidion resinicola]KAF2817788.1 hypothetical protein BDZ99DRAFT_432150 [Mytilinidion resinicola]
MDPLSAAASVLAVVETSSKVISLCRSYWKEVKDAENDIQRLLNEIETIHDLGQRIDSIQRSKDAGKFAAVIKFLSRNKTTEKCRKELEGLEIVLRKGCEKPSSRWVLSKFRKNWRWPLDKKDMEKVVGRMEKYGNVLQQALTIDVA